MTIARTRRIDGYRISARALYRLRNYYDLNLATGCHEWRGELCHGYGGQNINGEWHRVHRVSWAATNGFTTSDMLVLHHCDNKRCINPRHLYLGTSKENARDVALRMPEKLGNKPVIWDRHRIAVAASADKTIPELAAEVEMAAPIVRQAVNVMGLPYKRIYQKHAPTKKQKRDKLFAPSLAHHKANEAALMKAMERLS